MKKSFLLFCLVVLPFVFSNCNNGKTDGNSIDRDSILRADSIARVDSLMRADTTMLRDFYDQVVLTWSGTPEQEKKLLECITPEIKEKITSKYGYYKVFMFRTGLEDGPEDDSKLLSIEREENGWYTVNYSDMGTIGLSHILLSGEGVERKISDFVSERPKCSVCNGTGQIKCTYCDGEGVIEGDPEGIMGDGWRIGCPECGGEGGGTTDEEITPGKGVITCSYCGGDGIL